MGGKLGTKNGRGRAVLWFVLTVAIVFAVGFYRESMNDGESVHFSINYPASGSDAGGMGARGAEGLVVVNVAHTGVVKHLLQPRVINLSTHWLHNAGDRPRRVRLEAEGFVYPVRWESTERTWDERTHSIGRVLPPGSNATVDWFVTLPDPLPEGDSIMAGAIVVLDADTGQRLTRLPIHIVANDAGAAKAGDCCGGK